MSVVIEDSMRRVEETAKQNMATISTSQSQRIHYLDNLRALAMLLGVFLHAGLAYAEPAQSVWLATDIKSSVAVDASIWFIHLFRMSLFFLLSGYFAKLVVERKGVKKFLLGRCLRVAGPLLLFYPFLLVAMGIVIVFAISYLEVPTGLMGLIAKAARDSTESQKSNSTGTMHLWFLYYLMFFTLISALLCHLTWMKPQAFFRNRALLLLSPLVLAPAVFAAGSPLPAPDSLVPHWWPFAFYGLFYFAGWTLNGRENLLDTWRPYMWIIIALGMSLYVPYYWLLPVLDLDTMDLDALVAAESQQSFWLRSGEAVLTAYLSVLLTMASLLLGQHYLARKSPALSFVADASYWVYLIHLPIVIFLQTLVAPLDLPLWLKLGTVLLGTLIPCMATYAVFVRYTPLGWLLHGKRSFP